MYIPLWWFPLLNQFAFEPPIYIIFFLLAGMLCVAIGMGVYGLNLLLTRLRYPPRFHGYVLLYTVALPPLYGTVLSCGPIMFGVMIMWKWFQPASDGGLICSADPINSPSKMCFQDILDWQLIMSPELLLSGRRAIILLSIGLFNVYKFCVLAIPNYTIDEMKPDAVRAAERLKNEKELRKIKSAADKLKYDDEEDDVVASETFKPWVSFSAYTVCIAVFKANNSLNVI